MWYAIILGGGSGSRMGADRNKVLLELQGKSVIARSVQAFAGLVSGAVVVSREEDIPAVRSAVEGIPMPITVVPGGQTRQGSVWNGLCALPQACERCGDRHVNP